ncbi:MAG: hypothetical protein D4S02_05890 [Rhodocyclaceae bacterium]|nr:MAG: hypothetical protein D4S02_05890 [Rhodocyclaceae bacterium]
MLDRAALAALNHLLLGASWARARLAPFAGRAARLSLPPFRLDFRVSADGMLTASEVGREDCDVEIALPVETPFLAMQGSEAVAKATKISGSAEFADTLGFVLRNLRWDFEEDLSKAVGDIAAHRIAGQLRAFGAWQAQATQNLAENFAEYLTEEQPTLVNKRDLGAFSDAVNQLADDLAKLESRAQRFGA